MKNMKVIDDGSTHVCTCGAIFDEEGVCSNGHPITPLPEKKVVEDPTITPRICSQCGVSVPEGEQMCGNGHEQ